MYPFDMKLISRNVRDMEFKWDKKQVAKVGLLIWTKKQLRKNTIVYKNSFTDIFIFLTLPEKHMSVFKSKQLRCFSEVQVIGRN